MEIYNTKDDGNIQPVSLLCRGGKIPFEQLFVSIKHAIKSNITRFHDFMGNYIILVRKIIPHILLRK